MASNRERVTPVRILTVCLGNICRSPTAEAALIEAAAAAGVGVEVDSVGIGDWHVGAPPDSRMTAAAAAVGLSLAGSARQVVAAELADHDLVLAMDRSNLEALRQLGGIEPGDPRVRLLRDFDPEVTDGHGPLPPGDGPDVPDPWAGDLAGFDEVVVMVRRCARAVVDALSTGAVTTGAR